MEPICTFKRVKAILKKLGYHVKKAETYRPIKPVDVSIEDIENGTIEITDDGIFFKASNGQRHSGFMYKRDYHLVKYGKPRFHIRDCEVIQGFKRRGQFRAMHRWANEETVPVRDMDDNYTDKNISTLPLCSKCRAILEEQEREAYKDNKDFVVELKSVAFPGTGDTDVDVLGYTRDWQTISNKYRVKHLYTCERCGISITNPFDYDYMHCHHKDGNKINNREDNLECLCIECHSKVDNIHKERFSRGANQAQLQEFLRKYKPYKVKNGNK